MSDLEFAFQEDADIHPRPTMGEVSFVLPM